MAGEAPSRIGRPDSAAQRRRDWRVLIGATILPVLVTLWLFRLGVPLGVPNRFVYPYTPGALVGARLGVLPGALFAAVLLGLGVWWLGAAERGRRVRGGIIIVAAAGGLGVWTYLAPPQHLEQHTFNMQSPSQDGAFLHESFGIGDLRAYLAEFPRRARTPPEQMRGTRVVSNPPGMTILAYGVRLVVEGAPGLQRLLAAPFEFGEERLVSFRDIAAVGRLLTWVLTGIWLLAGIPLYALGRLFFGRVPSAALALVMLFAPALLFFSPGKDPAQLLSTATLVWLGLAAWRRGLAWWAAAAGGWLSVSLLVSLVHAWIAVIVLGAVVLAAEGSEERRRVIRLASAAAAGVGVMAVALWFGLGLNLFATAVSVARSQTEVTRGPAAMPVAQQALGIPLYLLFAGPALWAGLAGVRGGGDRSGRRLGAWLVWLTAAGMAVTAGFTNVETPRLWIPFSLLLMLGLALRGSAFMPDEPGARRLLATLVICQVVAGVLQWSVLDVRGAENRLITGQMFW